jgi:hypothetical protein
LIERPLDPARVFDALDRHQVDHVTVGGLAVGVWAYERATKDTDIVVPDADAENDTRLDAALGDLHAEPLPLEAPGARALGIRWQLDANVQRWSTDGGVLDVMRSPEGAAPYPELRARSEPTELLGARTRVVSRDDLVAMKLAAGRIQDLLDLDALLDPRNSEPTRVRLRAVDRDRLRAAGEPAELGEPVDPCERDVDELRRVLAPTVASEQLERELTRRGRELKQLGGRRLAALAGVPLRSIPDTLDRAAAQLGEAARQIEAAEHTEFELVRQRGRVPLWRRRERTEPEGRLDDATGHVNQLQDSAERGVRQLRDGVQQIEEWWEENGKAAVDTIAARRERYRRDRELLAERVRDAPEHPGEHVNVLIGERPARGGEEWDRAARCIEAYVAQYTPGAEGIRPPERPDRAQRGAWERMHRAVRELGVDPPEMQPRGRDTGHDLGH